MRIIPITSILLTCCGSATHYNRMPIGEVGPAMYELFSHYPSTVDEFDADQCPGGGMVYRVGNEALYARCGMSRLTVSGKVVTLSSGAFKSEGVNIIAYHVDDNQFEVACNFTITQTAGSICGRTYGGGQ